MILEAIFELVFMLLSIIFAQIHLPGLPSEVQSIVDQVIGYIVGAVDLLGFFLDWNMVKILIPIVIIIVNLDKIWHLIMFILRKIPFLGMQ